MELLYLSLICQIQSMPFLDLISYPSKYVPHLEEFIKSRNQLLTKIMTLHLTH